jgi:hypothetical protein
LRAIYGFNNWNMRYFLSSGEKILGQSRQMEARALLLARVLA